MRLWVLLSTGFIVVAAVGCGGTPVYPVKGKVTFEGKPLKGGGSISFMPTGKQEGRTGGGEIHEDGTYELTTFKSGDGSMEGEFRVVIHQSTEREPDASKDGERAVRSTSLVGKDEIIPRIYSDPTQSPLIAKVTKGSNELDFELHRNAGGPPQGGARLGNPLQGTFAGLKRTPLLARQD